MGVRSVSAIVFAENGKEVLLHQREDFLIWSLPGGHIEPGESWEEAGIREASEETGYRIRVDRLVGEYSRPQMPGGGDMKYVCVGRVIGGEPIESGPETLKVKWFPLDALPSSLPRFMCEYIRDARANIPRPLIKTQRMSLLEIIAIRLLLRLRKFRNRFIPRPRE